MIGKRVWGLVMAGATLWLTGLVGAGCGPSVASYCNKMCDCSGCDDEQRTTCVDGLQTTREASDDAGCAAEWDAHFACMNAEAQCSNGALDADGCEAEADALYACGGAFGFSCEDICGKLQQCGNDTASCISGCTDAKANAQATGCLAEFDQFAMCVAQADDTCGNGQEECAPKINAFLECASAFCEANPTAPACGSSGGSSGSGGASSGSSSGSGTTGAGGSGGT